MSNLICGKAAVGGNDNLTHDNLLAANINCEGALEIAYLLLEKGVFLNQKDLVYGNTAIFTLYLECLKQRREDVIRFLCECFEAGADLKEKNKRGLCLMDLIPERGPKEFERYLSVTNLL